MKDLIKEVRPNANEKYYLLIEHYIVRLINEFDAEFRNSVGEIIKDTPVSRPTFYSYFQNTGDFYKDLTTIYLAIVPGYLVKLSKELKTEDYLLIRYNFRICIALHNLLKISGNFSFLNPVLKEHYRKSVNDKSEYYRRTLDMEPETAKQRARIVVNELILNGDLYYRDFDTYKALMIDQKTTPLKT